MECLPSLRLGAVAAGLATPLRVFVYCRDERGLAGLCWASGKSSVVAGRGLKRLMPEAVHWETLEHGQQTDDNFPVF